MRMGAANFLARQLFADVVAAQGRRQHHVQHNERRPVFRHGVERLSPRLHDRHVVAFAFSAPPPDPAGCAGSSSTMRILVFMNQPRMDTSGANVTGWNAL